MSFTAHDPHEVAAHDDHAHGAHHAPSFVRRWLMSTNHKDIGTLYITSAVIGGSVGRHALDDHAGAADVSA